MQLNQILGTQHSLIQAPMAGVQDSGLALAVSAAGALGSLPAAMLDAQSLRRELQVLTDSGRPYNVNFFCHRMPAPSQVLEAKWRAVLLPYYAELGIYLAQTGSSITRRPIDDEMAEVLEEFTPVMVSFHFGLPHPKLLARVKARGAFVASSATTLNEARWLAAHGADGVIAQGLEAGGHRGHFLDQDVSLQAKTMDLLEQLAPEIRLPIIAAGGVADAHDVHAAMSRGAAAVQVGTAFLLCDEAKTSALHRLRLRQVNEPTTLTNLFTGGLARGLYNRLMHEIGPISASAPPFPLATSTVTPLRAKAESLALDDFTPLWSGSNRLGCKDGPAADVVAALVAGLPA